MKLQWQVTRANLNPGRELQYDKVPFFLGLSDAASVLQRPLNRKGPSRSAPDRLPRAGTLLTLRYTVSGKLAASGAACCDG
jgi:hypothetical protein